MNINFTTTFEVVELPDRPFLYVEKKGPFMQTAPVAWQEFWAACGPYIQQLPVDQMAGLSYINPNKTDDTRFVYEAGFFLKELPKNIPGHVLLRDFKSGKYAKFLLTGAYDQLSKAYPLAFEILNNNGTKLRDDFCAEIYLNTPQDTPTAELKTEILIPIL